MRPPDVDLLVFLQPAQLASVQIFITGYTSFQRKIIISRECVARNCLERLSLSQFFIMKAKKALVEAN